MEDFDLFSSLDKILQTELQPCIKAGDGKNPFGLHGDIFGSHASTIVD